MLHRQESARLVVITQPTHSWIAGCIARVWGEQFGFFAPREEVCLAAEQHDIGWVVWENAPTLNFKTGYPHNFTELPTEIHTQIWTGAKQLALPFGRYATLLVSLHGTGLFERFRNWQESPESSRLVKAYLEQEYAFQEQLIANLKSDSHYASYATPEIIDRNRSLVATWDMLSLTLCMGLREERQFHQVPTASGEITLTLTPADNDIIKVSPWVFEQKEVTLVYEGRLLQEKFADETAMRRALENATWVSITNRLIPA
ncbi:DUF3891 family protein [Gloeocapsopsis dulcis]|uniref:DUF3891 domain-containing protein n=1 Tax=Gloeocapsopsis dulcis AAB1 = 1H9 TaxID=1433147 RepID=A0A6N8FP87_9CHRO|nr:DUF3891 family protein [Gloeocapsopsis dulcis]MUL34919.1 hypothetical protein [Gloeocapsopsis dulcis AAB1 = 1H9]WNN90009.1 DUF3891 family protein [Gloeocapsopsis dulcis]